MPKTIFTADAEQNLQQITQRIADDNLLAALDWQSQIRLTCDLLATQPGMGEQAKSHRFGAVRRHSMGNYLIYYRPIQDGIEVLMIAHEARDQDRLV
jgi:toxin ParE1/3/4